MVEQLSNKKMFNFERVFPLLHASGREQLEQQAQSSHPVQAEAEDEGGGEVGHGQRL
jgi:hypothetical protein